MQETLLQSWIGLQRLQQPRNAGAWLLQIARNRCRDFHRSTQQRHRAMEADELEYLVNRRGQAQARERSTVDEIAEILQQMPDAEREVMQLFYLEGWTTAEIAARYQCPDDTVRRRLSHARDHVRQALGITRKGRSYAMSKKSATTKQQPFPKHRPEIKIEDTGAKPFEVDNREVRWWFIVPEIGERVRWAVYEAPGWNLVNAVEMQALRPMQIHGEKGIEIEVRESQTERSQITDMCARLTEDRVQLLSMSNLDNGERGWYTFLDENFEDDWGIMPRKLADSGYVEVRGDGVFERVGPPLPEVAAGVCSVRIDKQEFTCLRVFEVDEEISESDALIEAYITPDGRTLLSRRYNGRIWGKGGDPPYNWGEKPTWEEELPDSHRIVFNGKIFVHWYDNITASACGLDE